MAVNTTGDNINTFAHGVMGLMVPIVVYVIESPLFLNTGSGYKSLIALKIQVCEV
jgi:hypothetical protein